MEKVEAEVARLQKVVDNTEEMHLKIVHDVAEQLSPTGVQIDDANNLTDMVTALLSLLQSLSVENKDQAGVIEQASTDIQRLQDDAASLHEKLEASSALAESREERVQELTTAHSKAEAAARNAEERSQGLRKSLRKAEEQTEQQHAQLLQLRRQFKALQMQRTQGSQRISDSTSGDVGILTAEINRLKQELTVMSEKNKSLSNRLLTSESGTLKYIEGDNRGLVEMVRSYEAQLSAQEEEKQTMSLARASEVTMRLELTNKLARAQGENEELKGQIVSLQLQVERVRNKMAKLEASQSRLKESPPNEKENSSLHNKQEDKQSTPRKPKRPLRAKTPGKPLPFSPAPIGPPPAALQVPQASSVDTPSKCNQQ